jgi:hypothetical protein
LSRSAEFARPLPRPPLQQIKLWRCEDLTVVDHFCGATVTYYQRWASTLANRSNAQHRSNSRAPPPPPPPRTYVSKVWECVAKRGRKRFIASWGLRMSHICPCTPCHSPPGSRSKVESRHFAHLCLLPGYVQLGGRAGPPFLPQVGHLLQVSLDPCLGGREGRPLHSLRSIHPEQVEKITASRKEKAPGETGTCIARNVSTKFPGVRNLRGF